MKKYLYFTLHYCFFISALLFFPKEITIFMAIFLIMVITFENIIFSILPLSICFFIPIEYTFILIGAFLINLICYYFIRRNRFYALASFLLINACTFITLYILNGFNLIYIEIMLLLLIIYSIINILYVYQKQNNKTLIIPYNQKLIYLTLILGYFSITILFKGNNYIMYFLFMQLFLIEDIRYNVCFSLIYALITLIFKNNLSLIIPSIAVSFLPISVCLLLDYNNLISIPLTIYSIAINLVKIKKKKITIENDYINSLFDDFNKYINNLNEEYNKNIKIKELKEKKLEEISLHYCNKCLKNSLCKQKIEKRYSFISAAMLGLQQNIYDCPYYKLFNINTSIDNVNKSYEYSAIKELSIELSYLYNQSLSLKKEYEKFINLLSDYNYHVIDLDINLASSSLYFSIKLDNKKSIIESILIRCAYKAFGEKLEIKQIENKIYFYKKPLLKITYAHTILAKEGNLMSGDNYYIKKDYNSSYIFALSDGMGSGYNAYLESSDALKTISTLSSYHFRIQTILKLLEDIYELRSNYDRYATLDFLAIDTANRKLNLYKMGSTTTYILHNNRLITYENKALPLKLDEVNSAYELDVFSGDYIFLLSDGISDFVSNEEFFSLVKDKNGTADEVCYSIIEYIKRKENNRLKDDLSLIVIKAI